MRALDLFCGGGGAALGLASSGFAVTGVDLDARCAAVYPGVFVRANVFAPLVAEWARMYDFVWASPPCQRWSPPTNLRRGAGNVPPMETQPDHVGRTRALIERAGVPGVIENVPRAPLRADIRISGGGCGLPRLHRLRHFECVGWTPSVSDVTGPPRGSVSEGTLVTVTKRGGIPDRNICAARRRLRPDLSADRHLRHEMIEAMGLPADTALTMRQIGEAVPPRYAEIVMALFEEWRRDAG